MEYLTLALLFLPVFSLRSWHQLGWCFFHGEVNGIPTWKLFSWNLFYSKKKISIKTKSRKCFGVSVRSLRTWSLNVHVVVIYIVGIFSNCFLRLWIYIMCITSTNKRLVSDVHIDKTKLYFHIFGPWRELLTPDVRWPYFSQAFVLALAPCEVVQRVM